MPPCSARLDSPARSVRRWSALIVALVALTQSGSARAQFPDLLELSAHYMPYADVDDPAGAAVQLTGYDVVLNVPIVLDARTFLIPGVTYHVDALAFDDTPDDFVSPRAFHGLDLSLMLVRLLSDDWSLALRLAPGLAGDFGAVDARMLRLSAVAMATHTFSETFTLGGGAIVSYAFGTWLPLPAIYVDWRPAPWFRFETFVPGFARAVFLPTPGLELGLRADVSGNSYAIRDPRVRRACEANPDGCVDHVAYSLVTVGLEVNVRLFASVWLGAQAGRSVYRRYEALDRDDEPLPGAPATLADQFHVRAALTWRLPTE